LVGRSKGEGPLGRAEHRWVDNIKCILKNWDVEGMDWIALAQDRYRWQAVVNAVVILKVP
jgi:hypothetical protein